MSNRPFSPEEQEQLTKLEALPDADIDTTDIPEMSDEAWAMAKRRPLYRPTKRPVTIRLDADVLSWFKSHAGDKPYQSEINRVLRQHVSDFAKGDR